MLKGYAVFSVPAKPDKGFLLFDLLPHWPYNGDAVDGKS